MNYEYSDYYSKWFKLLPTYHIGLTTPTTKTKGTYSFEYVQRCH